MHNFTPISATIGGALIGLSAALLWLSIGRIAGISGIGRQSLAAALRRDRLAHCLHHGLDCGAAYLPRWRQPAATDSVARLAGADRHRGTLRRLRDTAWGRMHQRTWCVRYCASFAALSDGNHPVHVDRHRDGLRRPPHHRTVIAMPVILVALVSGLLFGLGLTISQMIDPAKVTGFLDLAGAWDPSLAFVIGDAVPVATIGFVMASAGARRCCRPRSRRLRRLCSICV